MNIRKFLTNIFEFQTTKTSRSQSDTILKQKGSYTLKKASKFFDHISVEIKLANLAINENDLLNFSIANKVLVFVIPKIMTT